MTEVEIRAYLNSLQTEREKRNLELLNAQRILAERAFRLSFDELGQAYLMVEDTAQLVILHEALSRYSHKEREERNDISTHYQWLKSDYEKLEERNEELTDLIHLQQMLIKELEKRKNAYLRKV